MVHAEPEGTPRRVAPGIGLGRRTRAVLALLVLLSRPLPVSGNYAIGDSAPLCWKLDKSNTAIECPRGLQAAWVPGQTVPPTIYVGVPVWLRLSLNFTLETFQHLERYNLLSKTGNVTAEEKWQQCRVPNEPCPAGKHGADECCLYHLNAHSCQNKPGLFCGPWVTDDGHLSTHTPAQTGALGPSGHTSFDFRVKLFWEGAYTIIAHVQLGAFHFAIGSMSEVKYGSKVCADRMLVPSRLGDCEPCQAGTQPLSMGIPLGARQITDSEAMATGVNPLCIACPPGRLSENGTGCTRCPKGSFAAAAGSSHCDLCSAGRHTYDDGMSYCRDCQAGTYAPPGAEVCSWCPRGRYRPLHYSGDGCAACPAPLSTIERHSKQRSDCVCPEGSYALNGGCVNCTEGMRCDAPALSKPKQAAGYQVRQAAAGRYEAQRCGMGHCPEAEAGMCSRGRGGLACGICDDWHFPKSDGTCKKCAGVDLIPAVAGLVMLLLSLCLLFMRAGADASRQRLSTLGLMCILGQVVVTVQMVSSLSTMQFELVDPLKTIVQSVRLMNLNLDSVKVQCAVGSDSPTLKYGLALASFPLLVLVQALVLGLLRCLSIKRLSPCDVANSLGLLLMLLFLPVTVICLQPFRCRSSPSGHDSVTSAASVLCGRAEHQAMLGIGAMGTLIYPITVMAGVASATFFYPRFVALGKSSELLRCCRFLFGRFTPKRYYYNVIYLTRSAWVALLPVAFPEPGYFLPFGSTLVVASVALLQVALWPWRTRLANANDLACGLFLVMVLAVTNALADLERSLLERQLSIILTICTAAGTLSMLILLLVAAAKALCLTGQKRYSLFLTHHKQGAGCLARLLKLRLTARLRPEIFLDSDNLEDLESLFDTVRCDTAHLLAILTEETLRRPWCAGEIVMALKNNVPLTIAACEALNLPSDAELFSICSIWSPEELHPLQAVGVTEANIRECYRQLHTLPRVALPRMLACEQDLAALEAALGDVALAAGGTVAESSRNVAPSNRRSSLSFLMGMRERPLTPLPLPEASKDVYKCIVANLADNEASAAAFVLQGMMNAATHDLPEVALGVPCIEGAAPAHGAVVVALLTRGCLESPIFVRTLLAAMERWPNSVAIVSVVADKSFAFPSQEEVTRSLAPAMADKLERKWGYRIRPESLAKTYGSVLQILALVFSAQLGSDILQTETGMICRRVEKAERALATAAEAAEVGRRVSNLSSKMSIDLQSPQSWGSAALRTVALAVSCQAQKLAKESMEKRAEMAPVELLALEEASPRAPHASLELPGLMSPKSPFSQGSQDVEGRRRVQI